VEEKPMSQTPVPGEPLLQFRLAYLRFLARTWRDFDFKKKIFHSENDGLITDCIQPTLYKYFACPTQWPNLKVQIFESNKLKQMVRWSEKNAVGWIGPNDKFEIILPKCPTQTNYMADALAAYYQIFPTILGPACTYPPAESQPLVANSVEPSAMGIPGGGPGSFLAFGSVILRAVMLSWKNSEFCGELTDTEDAVPILAKWFGFNMPFNFSIKFKSDLSSDFEGYYDNKNDKWIWKTWKEERDGTRSPIKWNHVILNYPTCPGDEDVRPAALVSYNNTGPAYPFTCN